MNIPDEAVEAGAVAWDKHMGGRYTPYEVDELSDEVRVILEAAAPILMAQAWGEGYEMRDTDSPHESDAINPYKVVP